MNDPLAALRPLHTPPPISWWPPAPGWWLLLLFIIVLSIFIYRYWQRRAPQRAALLELKNLEQDNTISQPIATLNQLLKRYALVCWPIHVVAPLSGEAWLNFLDANGGDGQFLNGPGRILLTDPYQPQSSHLDELTQLARRWIKSNRPGKHAHV